MPGYAGVPAPCAFEPAWDGGERRGLVGRVARVADTVDSSDSPFIISS